MQRFTYTVLARGTGLALKDALVTIYAAGTVDKATLYAEDDTGGDTLANPLTTDAYGGIEAFVPDGLYDLRVDHAAQPSRTIEDVQIFDLAELAALGPLASIDGEANQIAYFAGSSIVAITDFTQAARDLLAMTSAAEMAAYIGVGGGGGGTGLLSFLDTVSNAEWAGADLAIVNGGTGASDAATARDNLGLEIGADVMAYDADLAAIAALVSAANKMPYSTGAGTWAMADLSPFSRTLLDDADAATWIATLGLVDFAEASDSEGWTGTAVDRVITPNKLFDLALEVALVDGATITPDFNTGLNFKVTLGGNRALANPTNAKAGQSGVIVITQDGGGNRTLTYGANWRFPGGSAAGGVLSTAGGAIDVLAYFVRHDGTIMASVSQAFAA